MIHEILNTECVNLNSAIRRAIAKKKDQHSIKDLENKYSEKQKLYNVSELNIELYLARLELAKDRSPENKDLVNDAKAKLDIAVKTLSNNETTGILLKELKDAVATSVTTGFSASYGSTSHRRRTDVRGSPVPGEELNATPLSWRKEQTIRDSETVGADTLLTRPAPDFQSPSSGSPPSAPSACPACGSMLTGSTAAVPQW
jgi:hypothetical protein